VFAVCSAYRSGGGPRFNYRKGIPDAAYERLPYSVQPYPGGWVNQR
jgi:hypothetical protein